MKKEKVQIKGYKVTDSNMKCRTFQYEINKIFKHGGEVSLCNYGFHYCAVAADCFDYYSFDSNNRVFEIIDHGQSKTEGNKSCTNAIELIRELTWFEVLTIVNLGKGNTGVKNTGDSNTGYSNTGNWNTGDRNTGNSNTGNRNTGNRNTGNWNTGNWNTGDRNTGDSNTGYRNTGNRNTGNSNTGNWNTGDSNTGDSNTGYRNTGAFCTNNNPMVLLFDKETNMTVREWENHEAFNIMANYLNPNIWIYQSNMTDEEKEKYPSYKTAEGYLKSIPPHEEWSNMWHNLTDKKKQVFLDLPNFDKAKFKEITGIDV